MGVPAQTLAMIRRVTKAMLTDVCQIDVEVITRGEFGEDVITLSNVASYEPCRLITVGQRFGTAQQQAGGQETLRTEYRLIVGRQVALAVNQRVTVAGETYDVVRIETELTDEAFHSAILYGRE